MHCFKPILFITMCLCWLPASVIQAQMSSTSYMITSTVMSGGGGQMSSASYRLTSTLGQPSPPGSSTSISYAVDSGFWYTLLLYAVGDVNGDGDVDLEDVIAALQVVTGMTPESVMKASDADSDGKIGIGEAIIILNKLRN